ncbi:MAG: hypothetical protein ACLGIN_12685 [Candidatus Sericytochromatia bacterium]
MSHSHPALPSRRRTRRLLALAAAVALAGCDSRSHFTLQPPAPEAAVAAISRPQPAGARQIVIAETAPLPAEVRAARELKVSIQGQLLPVSKSPTGAYSFTIPAGLLPSEEKDGLMRLLLVIDAQRSRHVTIQTGSPIAFAADPVIAADGRVPAGMAVALEAATEASEEAYDFAWAYGPSADGPWQPIAQAGKRISWTPQQAGAYFLRIEASDRARQASHVAVTATPRLRVVEPDALFTLAPGSGTVDRGQAVDLGFAMPAGAPANQALAWYAGPGPQGPWTALTGKAASIRWMPTLPGSYHLRVDLGQPGGTTSAVISSRPLVTVLEGRPIITPSRQAASRGDRVDLTLDLPEAGQGPFSWYAARPGGAWAPIPGGGATVKFLPDQPGVYNFRVDLPLPDGTVKTFQTTDPILSVAEPTQLFTTTPMPATARAGDDVTLRFNGRGVEDGAYHYAWYVSANPQAQGWTPLTLDRPEDVRKTIRNWDIPLTQPAGSYYVRVDAIEDATGHTHTFVSTSPLVFVTLSD